MKIKLMLVIGAALALGSCGSHYEATSTGDVARNSFTVQYPNAMNAEWNRYDYNTVPIDWELAGWPVLDNNAYVVQFREDNYNYYAWYDASGNWIGSTYLVQDNNMIPTPINTMLTNRYSGYGITSVNRVMQKDRVAYQIEISNNDNVKRKLLVAEDGTIIKEKLKQ